MSSFGGNGPLSTVWKCRMYNKNLINVEPVEFELNSKPKNNDIVHLSAYLIRGHHNETAFTASHQWFGRQFYTGSPS